MTDRLTTLPDLTDPHGRHARPGLFQLRVLERQLRGRIAELDGRVDGLLDFVGLPTDEQVAAVDVLCAAMMELRELLTEVRAEAAHHLEHAQRRHSHPRRWA